MQLARSCHSELLQSQGLRGSRAKVPANSHESRASQVLDPTRLKHCPGERGRREERQQEPEAAGDATASRAFGSSPDARLKRMETVDQNGEQRILFLVKNIARLYALGSLESGTSSYGRNYFYALR